MSFIPMLPLWCVTLPGIPERAFVAARTRNEAKALVWRSDGPALLGYQYTDLRVRRYLCDEGWQDEYATDRPRMLTIPETAQFQKLSERGLCDA